MRLFCYIRLLIRVPLALIWTLLVHWFGIRLVQLFKPNRRCLGALSLWGRGLAWIMGIRVHLQNERTGPMGDLIIANHMGFLDVPVMLTYFPSVFIIKMEMRRVFYFGRCLERQGHVFVERGDQKSRRSAGKGIMKVLKQNDRIIVFPEGRASPGAERLEFAPFSFVLAKRLKKRVEACVIDYLPNRKMLEWDVNRPMRPQIVELFGRFRTHISLEFIPSEILEDEGEEAALRYHDLIQGKLEEHDRKQEAQEASAQEEAT
jgi:1-acyl-sn-glycerol-3-phosphate acyltransferase